MAYNVSDLFVALDVSQDSFTDYWMSLHLTTLVGCEWTHLFEQSRRKPDLADVVDEPSEVSKLLLVRGKSEPTRDVSRICRDRRRMPGCVPITRIERRYQRCRK